MELIRLLFFKRLKEITLFPFLTSKNLNFMENHIQGRIQKSDRGGGSQDIFWGAARKLFAPPPLKLYKCLNMEGIQQFLLFPIFSPFSFIFSLFLPFSFPLLKFWWGGNFPSKSGRGGVHV